VVWRADGLFGVRLACGLLGVALALALNCRSLPGSCCRLRWRLIVDRVEQGAQPGHGYAVGLWPTGRWPSVLSAVSLTAQPSALISAAYLFGEILAVHQRPILAIIWSGALLSYRPVGLALAKHCLSATLKNPDLANSERR